MQFVDLALSQLLEQTEGRCNAALVESRTRVSAESGSQCALIGQTYACFDGPSSPMTQTFGLGLFEPPNEQVFAQIEAFFQERKAPVLHEVSPLAAPETLVLLGQRGYAPLEFTSVMYLPLGEIPGATAPATNAALRTRRIAPTEAALWAQVSTRGWCADSPELGDFMLDFGQIAARSTGMHSFLVEADGQAIATGSMFVRGNVALLAGASTVPEGRSRGAQRALLRARLAWAAQHGCTLAMVCAQPGSQSQRNAQRAGFHIAYTRLKWHLPAT